MSKLWQSTAVISSITLISRVLGLIRDVVIVNVFGAGALMDAFLIAFKVPSFFRKLFSEGAFAQAFVPVLTEYKTQRNRAELQLLIASTAGALFVITAIITCMVVLAAPWIALIFAGGFSAEKLHTTIELLRITFPYFLFITLTAFAASVLNSFEHFATPAFAPILLNICLITAALIAVPHFNGSIEVLAWGIFIAGILQFAIHMPALWRRKLLVPPRLNPQHAGVTRILKMMLPALFAVSITQLNLLLNTVFASFMRDGSVTWLYTAERMSELPIGLIGVAIATVILPKLSTQHISLDDAAFQATLDWASKLILLFGIPASIGLFMLSDNLMHAIFIQEKFTHHDAHMSAFALKALSGGVLSFMLIKIFSSGFFAKHDTKTPIRVGIIAIAVHIILSPLLIALFKQASLPLHAAPALSSSLAAFINAGMLYFYLHIKGHFTFRAHWRKIALQFTLANLVMIAGLHSLIAYFPADAVQSTRFLYLLFLCIAGAICYAVTLLIVGFNTSQLKHS